MLADHALTIPALADAYGLKAAVYQRLTDVGMPVEPRAFLYSRCPLNGSVIVRGSDERLGWISDDSQPVLQPQVGKAYDFCLRASPMITATHRRRAGCRIRRAADAPEKWLLARCDEIGIELVTQYHRLTWTWCSKPSGDKRDGFYLPDVVFVGRLTVVDADKLMTALAVGIGRHRAFGFGLLQLF